MTALKVGSAFAALITAAAIFELIKNPTTSIWLEAWAVLLVLAYLGFLVWFHFRDPRLASGPYWARALGLATLMLAILVTVGFILAIRVDGSWEPRRPLLLLLAVVAALIGAAYHWPAGWLRGLAVAFLVLGAILVAAVGRHDLAVENASAARVSLTEMDARLAEISTSPDPTDGEKAVQQSLNDACKAAGGEFAAGPSTGAVEACKEKTEAARESC